MKRNVTKDEIERLRGSLDLAAVIEGRGVALARKGRNFVGKCPFHDDRTPSLVVNPHRQLWNCFGACKRNGGKSGGDVFAFVMNMEGVGFLEAFRSLSGETTHRRELVEPSDQPTLLAISEATDTKRRDLLERIVGHYHGVFRERPEGQDYLRSRGLTDPEMFAAVRVGYVDGSLLTTLASDIAPALKTLGILTTRGRELFLGCVVFPLTLPDIGVVGLYGRHVKRDGHLYLRGPRRGGFHWQAMKASREVILAESVIDALTLYQTGFRNVSAIYGTQGFTSDHEDLLQRFRVRRILLCLDNDEAGNHATEAITERVRGLGIDATDVRIPGAKDPNALLLASDAAALAAAFHYRLAELRDPTDRPLSQSSENATADPLLTVEATPPDGMDGNADRAQPSVSDGPRISREDGGGWLVTFAERSYRVRGLTPTGLSRLKVNLRVNDGRGVHVDTLDLYSHRTRRGLVEELARVFERDAEDLTREVASLVESLERLRLDLIKNGKDGTTAGRVEIPDREREEALALLRSADLVDRILGDFARVGFVGEETALTVSYLATVSRLLDEPLGLLIVSRSGAGKSSLQDAVCDFMPEEALAKYTRLTGQALFYKEENSLSHKVLAIDEEKGAEQAAYSLRILQSAQALTIAATRTDPLTGKLQTEEYRVRGPVAMLLTTTSPEALDYETRSRFVAVGIDESREQTRRILMRQRDADTLEGVLGREEASVVRRRHHNIHRLLRPLRVVNPFASLLDYPDDRLQMRREQKKYLTLIKTIALLHQHQREIKKGGHGDAEFEYVEVQPADITLANRLAREVLGRSLDELAPPSRLLLKDIVELTRTSGNPCFTRQEIRDATGWSDWQIRQYLGQLAELEYIVLIGGRKGKRMTYELLFEGDPEDDGRFLTGLVDVHELDQALASNAGQGVKRGAR